MDAAAMTFRQTSRSWALFVASILLHPVQIALSSAQRRRELAGACSEIRNHSSP